MDGAIKRSLSRSEDERQGSEAFESQKIFKKSVARPRRSPWLIPEYCGVPRLARLSGKVKRALEVAVS